MAIQEKQVTVKQAFCDACGAGPLAVYVTVVDDATGEVKVVLCGDHQATLSTGPV